MDDTVVQVTAEAMPHLSQTCTRVAWSRGPIQEPIRGNIDIITITTTITIAEIENVQKVELVLL